MKKNLFAIWGYESYPYLDGGEVLEINDNGWIRAKGYDGLWFKPLKITDRQEGRAILDKIDTMAEEHKNLSKVIDLAFINKLDKLGQENGFKMLDNIFTRPSVDASLRDNEYWEDRFKDENPPPRLKDRFKIK